MMPHKDLVQNLVMELYKMDLRELLEFKDNEERKLELLGYSKEIRDHIAIIIDVVIHEKETITCKE